MRLSQIKFLFALAAALSISAVAAAKWESVAVVKGERIELDKARIVRQGEGRTTAWSRLALDRDFIDEYGQRYTAIEALNRYDCEKHTFTTVKRVYSRDGKTVREEKVASPREMTADTGSADDLLLAEACKLRTVGEGQKVADMAAKVAAETRESKPTVMYADVRAAEAPSTAKLKKVAERVPDGKPAEVKAGDKSAEKSASTDKAAETKSGERPRYIELPKIDKSQFEEAAKGSATKPADAKADAKGAAQPVAARTDRPTEISAAARHELERQYASSGPRKIVRKKVDPAAETPVQEHRIIHWSYDGEGGPANWGKLRPDYATCASGRRQSPIDLRESIKVDLEPIRFDYKRTQFAIVDNGHTIQVNVGEGSTMRVMEREYQLLQIHFHRPSEERIGGRSFDMVIHLVHKDLDGHIAVIAVPLEKGSEHPVVQTLWNNMPLEQDQELSPAAAIDLNQLLPPAEKRAYYTYMGSLTTPPCTEDVLWMIFKQPLQVSSQQISIFSRLYNNNARPLQPANGRLVKESR